MLHRIHKHVSQPYWVPLSIALACFIAGIFVLFKYTGVGAITTGDPIDFTPIQLSPKQLPSPTPQISLLGKCTDSEEQTNYSTAGTLTLTSLSGQQTQVKDTCTSANTLREYSCGTGTLVQETYTCPSRCVNGACKGIVYVAHTVDTEARSYNLQTDYQKDLDLQDFEPGGLVDKVTDPNGWYRTTYKDSFGNPAKYSWFLLAGDMYCNSNLQTCTPIHDAMKPFANRIAASGDLLAYHYHHLGWTMNPGDGLYYWNQLMSMNGQQTANGTDVQVADRSLASIIINQHTYPSFFRSGWAWENTDFSNWLEKVIPFDSSNLSPNYNSNIATQGAIGNVYDWSRATQSWNPYHPSSTDYQAPGDMKRWQFRIGNQFSDFRNAFKQADSGQDVLITTVTHNFNYGQGMEYKDDLRSLSILYPGVAFKFVNALEGARAILKLTDTTVPSILVTRTGDTFRVTSNEPLFASPFAAVQVSGNDFRRLNPLVQSAEANGSLYTWTYNATSFATLKSAGTQPTIAFGGSDLAGNTFVTQTFSL